MGAKGDNSKNGILTKSPSEFLKSNTLENLD